MLGAATGQAKNNVLIVVADDLGVDYVSVYGEGSAPAPTPNIDALAKRGVLFRNAWANPSCSPTRASLMTGRYAFRHLTGRWIRYPNNSEPIGTLQAREWTLPEVLDRARSGFAHACIGKWHINDVREGLATPVTRGGWSHFTGTMWGDIGNYYAWPRVVAGRESTSRVYATTQQTDDAIRWIGQQTKPWVCYLAYSAPHKPFHAPPASLHTQKLTGLNPSRTPRPFYRAMIEAMDREMGRLFRALGPALAKTDVIFIGDNGSVQNTAVAPFLGSRAKGTPYEGGLNVPLIVAGPSVVAGGREVKALACAVDVFSTALDLCGATTSLPAWTQVDGRSLVPYLKNPQQSPLRRFAYSEEFRGAAWPTPNQNGYSVLRDERYKLIYRQTQANEFYDLVADRWEQKNLLRGTLTPAQRQAHTDLVNELGRLRTPRARTATFGSTACAGPRGPLTIQAIGAPRVGRSFDVVLANAPANRAAILAIGFSAQRWGALRLPIDLQPFGAGPGCTLASSAEVLSAFVTNASGQLRIPLRIPNRLALIDQAVFAAWLVPTATLVSSPSLAAVVGN